MNLKRRQFTRLFLRASVLLAALDKVSSAEAPSRIRLGTLVPKGSSYYRNLQVMGQDWRNATNGALGLTIYPDGAMGGEAEMVRRIRARQLQAGFLTAVGLRVIEPAVTGLQNLPLMFHDLDDVDYIGEQLQPLLEKRMADKGFVTLFWADAGWVRFFTKTPVRTPEEMKRLKIFCWSGDPDQFALMRQVGLQPVALEPSDILPALKTGMIEAVPMPPFMALAAQVDTVAPHMLELNYAPLVGAAVVDKNVWDAIPEATRTILLQHASATGKLVKRDSRAEAIASVNAMKARGLTVHQPTAAHVVQWRALLQKAYPTIRGKIVPADIFDQVEKLLRERHAAAGSAKGQSTTTGEKPPALYDRE